MSPAERRLALALTPFARLGGRNMHMLAYGELSDDMVILRETGKDAALVTVAQVREARAALAVVGPVDPPPVARGRRVSRLT